MITKWRIKMKKQMIGIALLAIAGSASAAITVGNIDDFSTTSENWFRGNNAPVQSTEVGPDAAAGVLSMAADGAGSMGRIQMWSNEADWTGDYNAAGVTGIEMWVKNPGTSDLALRLAFGGTGDGGGLVGDYWYSDAQTVVSGSAWSKLTFSLSDTFTGTSHAGGLPTGTFDDTLDSVFRMLVVSATNAPPVTGGFDADGKRIHFRGDLAVADVRFDDIKAIPEPATLGLIGSFGVAVLFIRRRLMM